MSARKCFECDGKRTYPSRRVAKAAAKTTPGRHMSAYQCAHGWGWHLGHLPKTVRRGTWPKDWWLAGKDAS